MAGGRPEGPTGAYHGEPHSGSFPDRGAIAGAAVGRRIGSGVAQIRVSGHAGGFHDQGIDANVVGVDPDG